MCLNLSCCLLKTLKLKKDSIGGSYSGGGSSLSLASASRFTGTWPGLSFAGHCLRLSLQYSRKETPCGPESWNIYILAL